MFCAFTASLAASLAHAAGLPPAAAEAKARAVEAKMTDDERFGLIKNLMVVNFRTMKRDQRVPAHIPQMAGWTPGVPRLGIPDLVMTDASLGITNPGNGRRNADGTPDSGTALPAGLLMGRRSMPLSHIAPERCWETKLANADSTCTWAAAST